MYTVSLQQCKHKKTNKKQTKRHKAKIYNFAHSPRMLKVNAMKS